MVEDVDVAAYVERHTMNKMTNGYVLRSLADQLCLLESPNCYRCYYCSSYDVGAVLDSIADEATIVHAVRMLAAMDVLEYCSATDCNSMAYLDNCSMLKVVVINSDRDLGNAIQADDD